MRFYEVLKIITEDDTKVIKRKSVKNDTVIRNYKNRIYHHSSYAGVRYSYSPTNKDIFADDWELVDIQEINDNYK